MAKAKIDRFLAQQEFCDLDEDLEILDHERSLICIRGLPSNWFDDSSPAMMRAKINILVGNRNFVFYKFRDEQGNMRVWFEGDGDQIRAIFLGPALSNPSYADIAEGYCCIFSNVIRSQDDSEGRFYTAETFSVSSLSHLHTTDIKSYVWYAYIE